MYQYQDESMHNDKEIKTSADRNEKNLLLICIAGMVRRDGPAALKQKDVI